MNFVSESKFRQDYQALSQITQNPRGGGHSLYIVVYLCSNLEVWFLACFVPFKGKLYLFKSIFFLRIIITF